MKFIIYDKVYDTEKSEAVYKESFLFETNTIYKTKKGAFFEVREGILKSTKASEISESMVKNLLKKDYDAYVKLFGELEEG